MSLLGARLRRSVGLPGSPNQGSRPLRDSLSEVSDAARRRALGTGAAVPLEKAVAGEPLETPFGPIWTVTHRHALGAHHGARRIGGFFERDLGDAHRLTGDPRLVGRLPEQALFVDIEATGLGHGAGIVAFLVGVAFQEQDEMVTRQYLMREPAEERALLWSLLQDLDAHPMLVTFNGKSYDLTVLESRMIICRHLDRETCRLKLRPHLDLTHLSRNLHRGRWPDTRLGTLERELLEFHRQDDLPGALVPSTWFHFLRTGDAAALARAVTHNLHDVWSMVVLADRLLEDARPEATQGRPPQVAANLGHLMLRRREPAWAVRVLSPFLDAPTQSPACTGALLTLSVAARRIGSTQLELDALRALHAITPTDSGVLERLSIALERRARDIPAALVAAAQAQRLSPEGKTAARVKRLEARMRRLGLSLC